MLIFLISEHSSEVKTQISGKLVAISIKYATFEGSFLMFSRAKKKFKMFSKIV